MSIKNSQFKKNLNDLFKNDEVKYNKMLESGKMKVHDCIYYDTRNKKFFLNELLDKKIEFRIKRYKEATKEGMTFAKYINDVIKCNNIEFYDPDTEIRIKNTEKFKQYLNCINGIKLFVEQQEILTSMIYDYFPDIKAKRKLRGKKLNPSTLIAVLNDDLNLSFSIKKFQETSGINRKKNYIIINQM